MGLQPDVVVIGKSIGGGVPIGAYGLSEELAADVMRRTESGDADIADVGGVGGTLAGNALSLAAARATLGEVLTREAFERMERLATDFTAGVQDAIDAHDLPWSVSRLGARGVPLRLPARARARSRPLRRTTSSTPTSTSRSSTAATS
ncbi:aminotransferase class III-fold pyridoxal phosphate-dependent enzyme [Janibacter melonis]|uniref:aminotransferase class III-fold pyridoxal phosphate-dependent enzyme n=1 Tax=Janibacter melonis TaxID=262209 RepID=UPI0020953C87|nr:aminotransferase class III-fold pyridoxal phosphate-dependent enzyme [Janibacter melonis]